MPVLVVIELEQGNVKAQTATITFTYTGILEHDQGNNPKAKWENAS